MNEKLNLTTNKEQLSEDQAKINREIGEAALFIVGFRKMYIDKNHSGYERTFSDGSIGYSVDRQKDYSGQPGDYFFGGDNSYDRTALHCWPRSLIGMHAIMAKSEDVVKIPEADDVYYVKDGAKVIARQIPKDEVEAHLEDHLNSPFLNNAQSAAEQTFKNLDSQQAKDFFSGK